MKILPLFLFICHFKVFFGYKAKKKKNGIGKKTRKEKRTKTTI